MKLGLYALLMALTQFCLAQSNRVDTSYFSRTQIMSRDSLYEGDTIRMTESYHAVWERLNDSTMTLIEIDYPQQIASRGEYLKIGENTWTQYGKWTYWYENGNIRRETQDLNDDLGTRYINQWLPDGTQTLKNGNGHYIEVTWKGLSDWDSVVYEIRNCIKQGHFKRWRTKNGGKSYYLFCQGRLNNNKVDGLKTCYYDNGSLYKIVEYIDHYENGWYQEFYTNGNLKEAGRKAKDDEIGNWKYWNEEGILIKECHFDEGSLKGPYLEYHPNGVVKLSGHYVHISGKVEVMAENENGDLELEMRDADDIPVKNGDWQHFNKEGKLMKKEQYIDGKLIM